MARYSEAHKRAVAKYNSKAYDDIKVRVPKGRKEVYKAFAESQGKSLNQMMIDLFEAEMRYFDFKEKKEA